tara:strand:+ start:786 stop:1547 length:762 start_codon:yes stop_codon:yes gene_type:complete
LQLSDIKRSSFTYKDYSYLLDALNDSVYNFSLFEIDKGEDNVVFLRHDIDKSIKKAFEIAKIENKKNIVSTFFFLTRSPLYNILEPDTIKTIREIHKMGHSIGLHIDFKRIKNTFTDVNIGINTILESEFRIMHEAIGDILGRVFSFHNPTSDLLNSSSYKNVLCAYDDNFMLPKTKYISDSNSFWREGSPIKNIRDKKWNRLQILTHPIWWTQDNPVNIIRLLNDTISERSKELDSYLKKSNSVYAKFKKGI